VLEGVLIYRSAAGLSLERGDVGYAIHAEQFVGGRRSTRVGLRLYSEITPIERWGLTDRENSLSTFVLHHDFRDQYERRGWSAYTRFARPGSRYDLTVEYRDERHAAVTPRSPWSLIDNDEPWRPQPLIAEGTLRSVAARWQYDTRNDAADPAAGWLIRTLVEQGLGGTLAQPTAAPAESDQPFGFQQSGRERFTLAQFDLRRYLRVSPYARLSLRVFASGSVDGTPLPPQRQQTLGGEGSLPGHPLFRFDCGARDRLVLADDREFFPSYGCDRAALAQAEFDAGFPFGRRIGRAIGVNTDLGAFRWVAFVDAGRAGTGSPSPNGRSDEEFVADAGVGLRIGSLGAYWAFPIARDADGVNFFVRLGRRF
jgi:outer membrane protein assembly factor BamA